MKKYLLFVLPLIFLFSRCASVKNTGQQVLSSSPSLTENIFSEITPAGKQASGLLSEKVTDPGIFTNDIFVQEAMTSVSSSEKTRNLIIPIDQKDEKDGTKQEPKLEPLVVGGTVLAVAGIGAAVAGIFGTPILFAVAALLLAASALVTAIGWKKIKAEPKKFKGEKFALANYIIIGLIGVLSSFYLIWLLFDI